MKILKDHKTTGLQDYKTWPVVFSLVVCSLVVCSPSKAQPFYGVETDGSGIVQRPLNFWSNEAALDLDFSNAVVLVAPTGGSSSLPAGWAGFTNGTYAWPLNLTLSTGIGSNNLSGKINLGQIDPAPGAGGLPVGWAGFTNGSVAFPLLGTLFTGIPYGAIGSPPWLTTVTSNNIASVNGGQINGTVPTNVIPMIDSNHVVTVNYGQVSGVPAFLTTVTSNNIASVNGGQINGTIPTNVIPMIDSNHVVTVNYGQVSGVPSFLTTVTSNNIASVNGGQINGAIPTNVIPMIDSNHVVTVNQGQINPTPGSAWLQPSNSFVLSTTTAYQPAGANLTNWDKLTTNLLWSLPYDASGSAAGVLGFANTQSNTAVANFSVTITNIIPTNAGASYPLTAQVWVFNTNQVAGGSGGDSTNTLVLLVDNANVTGLSSTVNFYEILIGGLGASGQTTESRVSSALGCSGTIIGYNFVANDLFSAGPSTNFTATLYQNGSSVASLKLYAGWGAYQSPFMTNIATAISFTSTDLFSIGLSGSNGPLKTPRIGILIKDLH